MKKALIARGRLLEAWQVVYAAVDRRATLPALAGVLLEADAEAQALRLTATDLALALRAEVQASVEDGFAVVLPAWEVLHWLKALAEGTVTLTVSEEAGDDAAVTAVCGPSEGRFVAMEAETFPPMDWTMPAQALRLPAAFVRRAARDVALAAAVTDSGRPVLEGVYWHRNADGLVAAAASDGYRLAVLASEVAAPEGFGVIVPADALRKAAPLAVADEVTVGWDERAVLLALGGGVMMSALLTSDEYPPYERIVPQRAASRVRVPRQALARALREMEVFAREMMRVAMHWTTTGLRLEAASSLLGRGETVTPGVLEGEPLEIGFNIRFLQDAVGAVRGDEVLLLGNAPGAPVVVRGVDDEGFFCVLMPMAL